MLVNGRGNLAPAILLVSIFVGFGFPNPLVKFGFSESSLNRTRILDKISNGENKKGQQKVVV